jgi:hypothetical protein
VWYVFYVFRASFVRQTENGRRKHACCRDKILCHGAFSFSPTMALLELNHWDIVVRTTSDNISTFQRRKFPSWPRARRLDFRRFRKSKRRQGVFSFSPTMAILELKRWDIVSHSRNDNIPTFHHRKSPSWPRARNAPWSVFAIKNRMGIVKKQFRKSKSSFRGFTYGVHKSATWG